jgi:hypothetical protein
VSALFEIPSTRSIVSRDPDDVLIGNQRTMCLFGLYPINVSSMMTCDSVATTEQNVHGIKICVQMFPQKATEIMLELFQQNFSNSFTKATFFKNEIQIVIIILPLLLQMSLVAKASYCLKYC